MADDATELFADNNLVVALMLSYNHATKLRKMPTNPWQECLHAACYGLSFPITAL
jgi:hypothetical protein